MNMPAKIIIIAVVLAAVGAVIVTKQTRTQRGAKQTSPAAVAPAAATASTAVVTAAPLPPPASAAGLPQLIDLGAGKCIPCKMMAPILADLKTSYVARLAVEFIDVWKDPDAGKAFNINLIPTQIFIAPDGRELFRHEGFFSKEDILAKWKELGYDFGK